MIEQFCSMEYNEVPAPYLSDKTPEDVFHGQAVRTVAYLRVSAAPAAPAHFDGLLHGTHHR